MSLDLVLCTSPPLHAQNVASQPATQPSGFLFRDSSQPVLFIGDDATAERMFTTLIETYTLSRFPAWNINFRNTGWEGDKIRFAGTRAPTGDQAIRRDIEAFHPQAVLVNYGLNDAKAGDASLAQYIAGINILARDLPRVGVNRTAFISVNPAEGYETDEPAGSKLNQTLQKYMMIMRERFPIGWQNGVEFVQKHPKGEVPRLLDGSFIDLYTPMVGFIEQGRKAGVLSRDEAADTKTFGLTSDGIHPNWSGSLIMASIILQHLNAPDLVSAASLDVATRTTTLAQGCTITWQDSPAGVVQFQRKDDTLPWPTPPDVDLALKISGFDPGSTLNRYELKISGLTASSYKLSIDDQEIGTYSLVDLRKGINLGFVRRGPVYDQGQKILTAVIAKNDVFFNRWRNVQIGPPPAQGLSAADVRKADADHFNEVKPQLARLDKTIADDERAIREMRQPSPHVFKLEPVGN
jgi:lysophospholipase L1-like esterase